MGTKPEERTTLLGKSKENKKIQNGCGNIILTDERQPMKETEKEQSKGQEENHPAKQGGFLTRTCLMMAMMRKVLWGKN